MDHDGVVSGASAGVRASSSPTGVQTEAALAPKRRSRHFDRVVVELPDLVPAAGMKVCFTPGAWHAFGPGEPTFQIAHEERFIRSAPIVFPTHDVTLVLRGRYDSILRFSDGSLVVCDFKTAPVKSEYLDKYWVQLHAYAYMLEHPGIGSLALPKIDRLGLGVFEPTTFQHNGVGGATLQGAMKWIDMGRDDQRFMNFLESVAAILGAPTAPKPSPNCGYCQYRGPRSNSGDVESRPNYLGVGGGIEMMRSLIGHAAVAGRCALWLVVQIGKADEDRARRRRSCRLDGPRSGRWADVRRALRLSASQRSHGTSVELCLLPGSKQSELGACAAVWSSSGNSSEETRGILLRGVKIAATRAAVAPLSALSPSRVGSRRHRSGPRLPA
jgi:hypothetical protein